MADLFDYGIIYQRGHLAVGLKAIDKVWVMSTCSPLSGQMAFRVAQYTDIDDVDKKKLQDMLHPTAKDAAQAGIVSEGWVSYLDRSLPYDSFLRKCGEASEALGLKVAVTKAFLSVDGPYPFYTDGHRGFRVEWRSRYLKFQIPTKPEHKSLKVIADPLWFDNDGKLLTPITDVIDRIKANEDIFADPFAERNAGRKQASIIKQISPGLRVTARKISRKT